MRLGEIKLDIDYVIDANKHIVINHEALYGGQAQQVNNYSHLIKALEHLSDQSWSGIDKGELQTIVKKYPKRLATVLPQEQFQKLDTAVNAANSKLPIYYSVLEYMVDKQGEQYVNIKLPNKVASLDDLSKLNERLDKIFTLYNVDGGFEFKQFDTGSDWYVIAAIGVLSHRFLLAGLDIAQKYFETKESYFKSETAKLDYRAAVDKTEKDVTAEDLEQYLERKMKLVVEEEVRKAMKNIGIGTNNENELHVKLVKATTKLIKELETEGTEFHLSLNPPKFAEEVHGELRIDYSKMPALKNAEEDDQKQIQAPKAEVAKKDEETKK